MRSSPQVWLFAAISAISRWMSAGIRGRPRRQTSGARRDDRDFGATARACWGAHDRKSSGHSTNRERSNTRRIVSPSRSDPAFDVTRELTGLQRLTPRRASGILRRVRAHNDGRLPRDGAFDAVSFLCRRCNRIAASRSLYQWESSQRSRLVHPQCNWVSEFPARVMFARPVQFTEDGRASESPP